MTDPIDALATDAEAAVAEEKARQKRAYAKFVEGMCAPERADPLLALAREIAELRADVRAMMKALIAFGGEAP